MYIDDRIVEAYVRGTIRHILRDDQDPALIDEWVKDRKQVLAYWEDTRHGLTKVAPLIAKMILESLVDELNEEFREARNNESNPMTKFFFYKKALNDGYGIAIHCLRRVFQRTFGEELKVE